MSSVPSQNFSNQPQNFVVGRPLQNFTPQQMISPQPLLNTTSDFKSWSDDLAPSTVFASLTSNNTTATSSSIANAPSSLLGPSKGKKAKNFLNVFFR